MSEVKTTIGADLGIIDLAPVTDCPIIVRAPEEDGNIRSDLLFRNYIEIRRAGSPTPLLQPIDSFSGTVVVHPFDRARIPCHYIPDGVYIQGDQELAYTQGLLVIGHGNDEKDGFYYITVVNVSNEPCTIADGAVLAQIMKR